MADRAYKILLMDDSETVVESTRMALEDDGYEVVTVSAPAQLSAVLRQENPDLVLMDVSMPQVEGHVLVEGVRRQQRLACPVVFYSGQPEGWLEALVRSSGVSGYISKTGDADLLLRAVARFLCLVPAGA